MMLRQEATLDSFIDREVKTFPAITEGCTQPQFGSISAVLTAKNAYAPINLYKTSTPLPQNQYESTRNAENFER
jgi:hypothetical protein